MVLLAFTLPTLVLPPVAERLSLMYRPSMIIPRGMYVIGAGFPLLNLGAGAENANWLTIVPGLLLSGIGLRLTSTPVTNTTTASVPSNRSGMASGIDMSARLVTLAVNISVMGIPLSAGILNSLRERLPGQQVQNGDSPAALRDAFPQLTLPDSSGNLVPSAVARGFGLVTLYGGIAVRVLATASLIVFGVFHRPKVSNGVAVTNSGSTPTDDHQQETGAGDRL